MYLLYWIWGGGGGGGVHQGLGWTTYFIMLASGFVRMLARVVLCVIIFCFPFFQELKFDIFLLFQCNFLARTQWDYQCSSKRQSIKILFVWFVCPLWLFLTHSAVDIQLLPYLTEYTLMGQPCIVLPFPTRLVCMGVSSFVTGCPCCVWDSEWTICPTYIKSIYFLKNILSISMSVSSIEY